MQGIEDEPLAFQKIRSQDLRFHKFWQVGVSEAPIKTCVKTERLSCPGDLTAASPPLAPSVLSELTSLSQPHFCLSPERLVAGLLKHSVYSASLSECKTYFPLKFLWAGFKATQLTISLFIFHPLVVLASDGGWMAVSSHSLCIICHVLAW